MVRTRKELHGKTHTNTERRIHTTHRGASGQPHSAQLRTQGRRRRGRSLQAAGSYFESLIFKNRINYCTESDTTHLSLVTRAASAPAPRKPEERAVCERRAGARGIAALHTALC